MNWMTIEGLPFGFEIRACADGWVLFRHDKFLSSAETLEDIFDTMCKLRVSHIDNPAST